MQLTTVHTESLIKGELQKNLPGDMIFFLSLDLMKHAYFETLFLIFKK